MEIKEEILQIIENLYQEDLVELLQHLRQIGQSIQERMPFSYNLEIILTEDRELLEKLAK